jgi:hypothetical protein
MADTLDVRIAHLEGGYEQIDKRLGTLEARLGAVEARLGSFQAEMRTELSTLRRELQDRMDSHFRWVLGFHIATLVSLLGSLLTFILMQ